MKKMIKKAGKKGFTLVELVIVIAVLAILAAIAIPVITTTIDSAKVGVMQSDAESLDMLVKTAVIELSQDLPGTTYNKKKISPNTTVEDVLIESGIYDFNLSRNIDGEEYYIVLDSGKIGVSTDNSKAISKTTTLATFSQLYKI